MTYVESLDFQNAWDFGAFYICGQALASALTSSENFHVCSVCSVGLPVVPIRVS